MIWFVLVNALFTLFLAFAFSTGNLFSTFLFKFVPFLLSVGTLYYFLTTMNYI